ncbi:MAG: helix-turn-helix domain-containing protein [Candidatus Methanoperedens sp.]|nr:helix-turn-helix domain-containing protein [Candidatus Methanoperedens sp.]MCE8427183.1 helix-turn-helix domain-containing protein [Candidatus Methanoperedens sp.]
MKTISKHLLHTPDWLISFEKEAASEIVLDPQPGELISDYRMRYGISQEELGELMDLRRESISRIENGGVTPTFVFVRKFVKAMGLIEAIRVERAQHKEIDVRLIENIARDSTISREKMPFILKIAIESYDKKLSKIQKSLKKK